MVQEIIVNLSTKMFSPLVEEHEQLIFFYKKSYPELLESFAKRIDDYQSAYDRLINKKYFDSESAKKEYEDAKATIIKFYNSICK